MKLATHVAPRITDQDRFVLRKLAREVARPGMRIAEVGSFLGNGSTLALLEVAAEFGGEVVCIDTWRGSTNVQWHLDLARDHDLFATFRHHVGEAGFSSQCKPMVMESLVAAQFVADGAFDLVFIDGDHSYEAVKADVAAWTPKLRDGGILCGHDCEGEVGEFGRETLRANVDQDFVQIEGFRFAGYHPGCILAVDETVGEAARLWSLTDLAELGFTGRSTIWSTTPHTAEQAARVA